MPDEKSWPLCEACDGEMARFHKVCPKCLSLVRNILATEALPQDEKICREMERQGWKEVKRYDFKKRTSLIFENNTTGEQIAIDIIKEGKWPEISKLLNTPSTPSRSRRARSSRRYLTNRSCQSR